MLRLRARINMLDGPYILNSDEPLSDEGLLAYFEQQQLRKGKHNEEV